MFWKRHSVNLKVVKDPKAPVDTPEEIQASVDAVAAYAEIIKDVVTHTAIVVGGVWCICKVVERLCR